MVESGKMMRSTDEWEMSRSCHSGTFSNAAWVLRADHARQPADLLRGDGVPLVRHRRGPLLLLGEELLRLAHFGALQMADLDRNLIQGRSQHGQGGDVSGVAVALDHLGGDRIGAQSQPGADALLRAPA